MIMSRREALGLGTAIGLAILGINLFLDGNATEAQTAAPIPSSRNSGVTGKKKESVPVAEKPGQSVANGANESKAESATKSASTSPVLKTPAGEIAVLPADNPWNQDISRLPVHKHSRDYIQIGRAHV